MYMFMFMRLEMFLENHDHLLKYQHISKKDCLFENVKYHELEQ